MDERDSLINYENRRKKKKELVSSSSQPNLFNNDFWKMVILFIKFDFILVMMRRKFIVKNASNVDKNDFYGDRITIIL